MPPDEPLLSEYPPPRAWPRQPGVHHVLPDETSHPVGSCTDACRAADGPYAARPGWIVRVQSSGTHQRADGNTTP